MFYDILNELKYTRNYYDKKLFWDFSSILDYTRESYIILLSVPVRFSYFQKIGVSYRIFENFVEISTLFKNNPIVFDSRVVKRLKI